MLAYGQHMPAYASIYLIPLPFLINRPHYERGRVLQQTRGGINQKFRLCLFSMALTHTFTKPYLCIIGNCNPISLNWLCLLKSISALMKQVASTSILLQRSPRLEDLRIYAITWLHMCTVFLCGNSDSVFHMWASKLVKEWTPLAEDSGIVMARFEDCRNL